MRPNHSVAKVVDYIGMNWVGTGVTKSATLKRLVKEGLFEEVISEQRPK